MLYVPTEKLAGKGLIYSRVNCIFPTEADTNLPTSPTSSLMPKGRVLFDFKAEAEDDLSVKVGEIANSCARIPSLLCSQNAIGPIGHYWWFCKMSDDLFKTIRHYLIIWKSFHEHWNWNVWWCFENVWWFAQIHWTYFLMINKLFVNTVLRCMTQWCQTKRSTHHTLVCVWELQIQNYNHNCQESMS